MQVVTGRTRLRRMRRSIAVFTAVLMLVGCGRDSGPQSAQRDGGNTPPESFDALLAWAYEHLLTPPGGLRSSAPRPGDHLVEDRDHRGRENAPPLSFVARLAEAEITCDWRPSEEVREAIRLLANGRWSQPPPGAIADVRQIEGRSIRCLLLPNTRINGRSIGEIRLRADFGAAGEFILAWSTPGKIAVPCSPKDGMVTRRISTDSLSDWQRDIAFFLVGVPASQQEDFQIESLSLHPAEAAYPQTVGSRRVRRGREIREAVYAHAPASIVFRNVPLPAGGRVESGMTLEGGPDARVRITLRDSSGAKTLIQRDLALTGQWVDVRADVGDWAGKSADVVFEAEGPRGSVVCWSNPLIYVPQSNPPRVLFYLIDTLGATHMSLYGYERRTTPHLEALAGRGVWFSNAFANASRTIESVPNVLLSLPTDSHGLRNEFASVPAGMELLAEDFHRAGYATACFSTNVNMGPRQNLDRGFDAFFDYFGYMRTEEADARTIPLDEVVRWCRDHRERPTFLYVHTAEPHAPYDPPAPFDTMFDPDYAGKITGSHEDPLFGFMAARAPRDVQHVVALYDGEVAYADVQFGRFLERLAELDLDDGLVIVVTSDHGEQFLEHGQWKHGRDVHGELIRVPLIMAGPPELIPARRVDAPVQLLDIRPTLLDLLQIPATSLLSGDSLRPLMQGQGAARFRQRPILSSTYQPFPAHHALIRMPYKIMFKPVPDDPRASFKLFDIEKDPTEHDDILEAHRDKAAELIAEMVRVRRELPRLRSPADSDGMLSIDREQLELLESLGYLTRD